MKKKFAFDVPIYGLKEDYPDVFSQVRLAERYYLDGNYAEAARIWVDAAEVGNVKASYRLAVLLKDTEVIPLPRRERFRRSEQLLLKFCGRYPDGRIELELADLYFHSGRYASAVGYLLKAKQRGAQAEPGLLETYRKHLERSSIEVGNDPHGSYVLGSALVDAGLLEKGIFFLEQAVEYGGSSQWAACAALEAARACDGLQGYEGLRRKYLDQASRLGNPELLRRRIHPPAG
ncbi:MAG: hypothetical protein IJO21_07535 [Oscillospiraceae bacterium]|nr:hypothetical protein [Oscillospiraceae bacterium]MBQ7130870.1 hypothetical protein [Oscillospiraceae bacterium]